MACTIGMVIGTHTRNIVAIVRVMSDVESLDNRDLTRAVQQACLHPCVHCPQCDTQGSGDIHLVIVEGTMILALA